jgi:hypothetical protein
MSSRAKSKGMMGGREEARGDSPTDSFALLSSDEVINLEQDCLILDDSFARSGLFVVIHDSIELVDSAKKKQATGNARDLILENKSKLMPVCSFDGTHAVFPVQASCAHAHCKEQGAREEEDYCDSKSSMIMGNFKLEY